MKTKIYLIDLIKREGALFADTRHDVDGWLVRLWFKDGLSKDIKLARHTELDREGYTT